MCTHMCTCTHRQRERQRRTQTHRYTHTDTNTHVHTWAQRHINTETNVHTQVHRGKQKYTCTHIQRHTDALTLSTAFLYGPHCDDREGRPQAHMLPSKTPDALDGTPVGQERTLVVDPGFPEPEHPQSLYSAQPSCEHSEDTPEITSAVRGRDVPGGRLAWGPRGSAGQDPSLTPGRSVTSSRHHAESELNPGLWPPRPGRPLPLLSPASPQRRQVQNPSSHCSNSGCWGPGFRAQPLAHGHCACTGHKADWSLFLVIDPF